MAVWSPSSWAVRAAGGSWDARVNDALELVFHQGRHPTRLATNVSFGIRGHHGWTPSSALSRAFGLRRTRVMIVFAACLRIQSVSLEVAKGAERRHHSHGRA